MELTFKRLHFKNLLIYPIFDRVLLEFFGKELWTINTDKSFRHAENFLHFCKKSQL